LEATFSERSPGSILESVRDPDRRRLRNARLITLPTRGSQKLRSRSVLFSEGDPATEVFEVIKGAVMVLRPLSGGRRQILDVVGPGRMVGFTARPVHDCTAIALATTQVIAFNRHNARGRPQGGKDFDIAVLAEVDRLRRLASLLGRKTAIERLATFLADLLADGDESQVVRLLLSRQEIADHLGLALETVSRSLLALKQRGVIARAGRTSVTVLDCSALRQIAAGDGGTIG
jgi:CRP-like cAMP-binding protein